MISAHEAGRLAALFQVLVMVVILSGCLEAPRSENVQRRAAAATLIVVIVMVTMMFASMPSMIAAPSMIVVEMPIPTVVIVPVVVPVPIVMLAGKIGISRPVPAVIKHRVVVVETIPRPDADEHAVDKILRSPVTVGSATERIVRVVSVRACRGNVIVAVIMTDMDTERNLGR